MGKPHVRPTGSASTSYSEVLEPCWVTDLPSLCLQAEFLGFLRELGPDLCLTAAYGNILPKAFLEIPKHGTLNIHPSLLPKYRGAAPVQRALQVDGTPFTNRDPPWQASTLLGTSKAVRDWHFVETTQPSAMMLKSRDTKDRAALCACNKEHSDLYSFRPRTAYALAGWLDTYWRQRCFHSESHGCGANLGTSTSGCGPLDPDP